MTLSFKCCTFHNLPDLKMHLRWERFVQNLCSVQFMNYVRFEVFTAVTMKNAVLWDVAPCRSCVNRRFGGTYRLQLQGRKIRE
jgi:hypothetical protein